MSQVIPCPNCDKKLAVRDELKGRALICPQCKGRFTVPADGPQPAAGESGTASGAAPAPGGFDMGFLDNLGPAPGSATVKAATKTAAPVRAKASTARVAPTVLGASRGTASRAKKKKDQMMMIYIGGGLAAAVLVVILLAVAISGAGGGKPTRFGMTESQRKHLFKDLFHAVDEIGSTNQYKDCREKWRQLGKPWNLTDQQIAAVRQEGIDEGWEQPAVAATMDQKEKTNRFDWIRTMNETKRDPVMSQ